MSGEDTILSAESQPFAAERIKDHISIESQILDEFTLENNNEESTDPAQSKNLILSAGSQPQAAERIMNATETEIEFKSEQEAIKRLSLPGSYYEQCFAMIPTNEEEPNWETTNLQYLIDYIPDSDPLEAPVTEELDYCPFCQQEEPDLMDGEFVGYAYHKPK